MRNGRVLGGWGQAFRGLGQRVAFIKSSCLLPPVEKGFAMYLPGHGNCLQQQKPDSSSSSCFCAYFEMCVLVLALIVISNKFGHFIHESYCTSLHTDLYWCILMKDLTVKIWRFNCGFCALNECIQRSNSRDFSPCACVPFTAVHFHTAAATWAHVRDRSRVS